MAYAQGRFLQWEKDYQASIDTRCLRSGIHVPVWSLKVTGSGPASFRPYIEKNLFLFLTITHLKGAVRRYEYSVRGNMREMVLVFEEINQPFPVGREIVRNKDFQGCSAGQVTHTFKADAVFDEVAHQRFRKSFERSKTWVLCVIAQDATVAEIDIDSQRILNVYSLARDNPFPFT